ncbi:hypothetical protein OPV22_020175 [Ensete ventricosum]|uniref:Pectinesterase inhibitor domain-containing protein n=1 Tax=Ensete ventricosum TaxID=4639 RepID=A0AAV8QI56_ENSVE|nr:hypothetical protein OPV22_020175 [Ensete ventricosum]RZR82463.1 hypothetical protein BHM03_00008887 [Ensete ventricosum]
MASSPFFFFFFLLLLIPSLGSPPSSTLIQTTCSLTSNYDFCVAALRSDPRSLRAKDVKSLSAIALRIAVAKAKTTAAYSASLAKNATEVAASRSVFGTCVEKYKNAGEALRWALGSLAQENYDYACVHVGAAQEYASTCGRLFRRNPGMAFPATMAKREDELQRLCGTAFDIISQLG